MLLRLHDGHHLPAGHGVLAWHFVCTDTHTACRSTWSAAQTDDSTVDEDCGSCAAAWHDGVECTPLHHPQKTTWSSESCVLFLLWNRGLRGPVV